MEALISISLSPLLLTAFLAGVLLLIVFFWAARNRWFARWSNGFFLTLLAAIGGTALFSAVILALWGYQASVNLLSKETAKQLDNITRIIEVELEEEIEFAFAQLSRAADRLASYVEARDQSGALQEIGAIEQINPRFLQISIYDAQGTLLAVRSVKDEVELVDRVGVAFGLEGRRYVSDPYLSTVFNSYALLLTLPVKSADGELVGVVGCRYDFDEDIQSLIRVTQFGRTGYAVVVSARGRIVAHPDPSRIGDDISSYEAVQRGLQGLTGSVEGVSKAGLPRYFHYRPLPGPGSINPQLLVVLAEMDSGEATAPVYELRHQLLLGMGFLILIVVVAARQLSTYIRRPLNELSQLAERVEQGDFTTPAQVTGIDDFGRLAGSLNRMVHGLQERDRVKELFGRYVTTQVSQEILSGDINLGGESRRVTILFSDIRDFTTMSEQMPPDQVVRFLNDYFSEMVEAVFEQKGVLDKFLGDGMMAVFGSLGDLTDHPRRAVLAALRMKALLSKINGERGVAGKPPIAIGIGIHTDEVIVGNIGSRKRLEYTVIGDGVNTTSRIQGLNKEFGTTILITETTYAEVKDQFECRPMPETQLKGKTRPLRFYEVTSLAKGEAAPS